MESKSPKPRSGQAENVAGDSASSAEKPDGAARSLVDPGRLAVLVVLVLIVTSANAGAKYIADPAAIPQAWVNPVAAAVALTAGLSTATLMTLIYTMIFIREYAVPSHFIRAVGQYAAVGAILGALWGLRASGPPLRLTLDAQTSPPAFADFLSLVSDTTTLLILFFTALCWWRIWGLFVARDFPPPEKWTIRFVVITANWFGLRAGVAAWHMIA